MKIKIYILTIMLALFTITGCDKGFEDMNKDPFNPTETSVSPVFNKLSMSILKGWQEQTGLESELAGFASQVTNMYGTSGYLPNNAATDTWKDYYLYRANDALMDRLIADSENDLNYDNIVAQKSVYHAYKTLKMLDLFGDIPYYDAGRAVEGPEYFYPKYDDSKPVYLEMIEMLKAADANMVESPGDDYAKLGGYDVLFNDDITKWRKFANSVRLRQALRAVDKESSLASHVSDILGGNLPLIEDGEDIELDPKILDLDLRARIWAYGGAKIRFGTSMFYAMADGTEKADIFDPRLELFSERNSAGEWNPMPFQDIEPESGNPNAENRWQDEANAGTYLYSPVNYWILTGRYSVPELVISAAEVHFLKAEAYAKGVGVSVNMAKAKQEYEAGIKSSITYWFAVANMSKDFADDYSWRDVPPTPGDDEINAMLANAKVAWSDSNALKLIYTQRWVSHLRQPLQAWGVWRQTRMTPQSPPEFTFNRLTYPAIESTNNGDNYRTQVSKMGADDFSIKVWWQK